MNRNYRVAHRPKSEPLLGYFLAEVYYDEDWHVLHYTESVAPQGDVVEELYEDASGLMRAFDEEPLNLDYVDYLLQRKAGLGKE